MFWECEWNEGSKEFENKEFWGFKIFEEFKGFEKPKEF